MKFCISLGIIELKYIIYCFLSVILYIYIYYFILEDEDEDENEENIIKKHKLLYSFCYFLGYLLNVILEWIVDIKSETKERPKINKILNFFLYCLIILFIGLIKSNLSLINNKKEKTDNTIGIYDDDFMIIEYLIIFLVSKYAYNIEVYYKHQNISFLILILVEAFKTIYFFIKANSYEISDIIIIILVILNSILYSISYLYIKGLMKYNFISPYRCNRINCIYKAKKEEKNDNIKEEKKYNDDFMIIEYLIIFLVSKYDKEAYYKHQNISFLILILVEANKTIYFFIIKDSYGISEIIIIILVLLNSILYSISYLYIKRLMKYNFISPYKCNYMIGIINSPLIIIIYIIISFTPLGEENNYYYCDNIFALFREGINDIKDIIFLISIPFAYGILLFFLNIIIYEYTIYHIYIPILIEYFIRNIIKNLGLVENIILISSFFIELIMILVFVEIIEIKYCGLDENLKRNIELRGMRDSSTNIEVDDDDFDETKDFKEANK